MSLDGCGCKIRKVSRCRPTVSNKIILALVAFLAGAFLYKSTPVQSITDIELLGFGKYSSPECLFRPTLPLSFFYFKLFFRTKVSQNAFNFNQIES